MRIAFLCKRQYTNKDVILDRYGRLYEIPRQLAQRGHQVRAYVLSYQGHASGTWQHEVRGGGVLEWISHSLHGARLPSLVRYPRQTLASLQAWRPDVLIGASDIPHVALTRWLAERLRVPYALDIYDNFAGFGQARIPGFMPALRWAVKQAPLVVAVSGPLRELITHEFGATGVVLVMPNSVDAAVFRPLDKAQCRQSLGLPLNAELIGTAGGLEAARGIDVLYRAWATIAAQNPQAHLVLAGAVDPECPPPTGERVHYLGMLAHERTAELFNALDVGVVYLRDTAFGRFCFPQKAAEMVACRLPLVAAHMGVMGELMAGAPASLYDADNPVDLARAVGAQLQSPVLAGSAVHDWAQAVGQLERGLMCMQGSPLAKV